MDLLDAYIIGLDIGSGFIVVLGASGTEGQGTYGFLRAMKLDRLFLFRQEVSSSLGIDCDMKGRGSRLVCQLKQFYKYFSYSYVVLLKKL